MKKTILKLTSLVLSVLILQSINPVFSEALALSPKKYEDNYQKKEMMKNIPNQLFSSIEQEMYNAVTLDNNTYFDLYSIGTENDDGTKSIITFNHPIKYFNSETGCVEFIDNKFKPEVVDESIKYVSQGNSYHATFSENIDDGIILSYEQFSLSMKPMKHLENVKAELVENELIYGNVFDESTDICYTLENTGIKESIVVEEPNECNEYDFAFIADNVFPKETKGQTITFINKTTGEDAFTIQPTYIIDSYIGDYVDEENHISYNNYYEVEKLEENSFIIHMILDEKFLSAESTVYPCVIDPSIDVTTMYSDGSSSYVMQSGGSGYINTQLSAGDFNGTGEHMSYVKANSIERLRWINPENIQSASFVVKSASTGYTNNCKVNLYDSTTNSNVSAVTYSELISSLGTLQSSVTFTTLGTNYYFDITNLLKQWISYKLGMEGKNPVFGFILRGEVGAPGRWFSSTNTSDTYFSIVYNNSIEIEDGFYNIKNVYTGKYLTYNNGNQLTLSTNASSDACKWQIILSRNYDRTIENGAYVISPYNNLNVSMKGASTGNIVNTATVGNKYRIILNSDNTFRIMPDNADNAGISNALGIELNKAYIREYNYISTMSWTFEPVVNRYFSEYTPEKCNGYPIKERLNCYAYSFGFIEHYYALKYNMQRPGLFASDSDWSSIESLFDTDATGLMNKMIFNLNLDASNLGYTLTEYTPSDGIVEQFGANTRLIAVVVGTYNNRFHFYMQHNDGTWSHKNGDINDARNTAFSSTSSNLIYLNNNNILQYAYDTYETGVLKFFIITKDSIIEYPHGLSETSEQNDFYITDVAGDNMFTSSNIEIGDKTGCIDTPHDIDYFIFTPQETRNYTIRTSSFKTNRDSIIYDVDVDDIDCEVYNQNGQLIYTIRNIGQINTTLNLVDGQNYFIKIYNYSQKECDYHIILA